MIKTAPVSNDSIWIVLYFKYTTNIHHATAFHLDNTSKIEVFKDIVFYKQKCGSC